MAIARFVNKMPSLPLVVVISMRAKLGHPRNLGHGTLIH
jgi:hypothetical protein